MTKISFLAQVTLQLILYRIVTSVLRRKRLAGPGIMCRILPSTVGHITNKKNLWH